VDALDMIKEAASVFVLFVPGTTFSVAKAEVEALGVPLKRSPSTAVGEDGLDWGYEKIGVWPVASDRRLLRVIFSTSAITQAFTDAAAVHLTRTSSTRRMLAVVPAYTVEGTASVDGAHLYQRGLHQMMTMWQLHLGQRGVAQSTNLMFSFAALPTNDERDILRLHDQSIAAPTLADVTVGGASAAPTPAPTPTPTAAPTAAPTPVTPAATPTPAAAPGSAAAASTGAGDAQASPIVWAPGVRTGSRLTDDLIVAYSSPTKIVHKGVTKYVSFKTGFVADSKAMAVCLGCVDCFKGHQGNSFSCFYQCSHPDGYRYELLSVTTCLLPVS
jgi:hypothetical protein